MPLRLPAYLRLRATLNPWARTWSGPNSISSRSQWFRPIFHPAIYLALLMPLEAQARSRDGGSLGWLIFIVVVGTIAYLIGRGQGETSKAAEVKRQEANLKRKYDEKFRLVQELDQTLRKGPLATRHFLARFIAEADRAIDEAEERSLTSGRRAAYRAADQVKLSNQEKRQWKERAKFLEHQLLTYKDCLLYTSPSPRDLSTSRMPSSA